MRLHRRKQGWTLEHLSKLSGVSVAAISKIENGKSRPSFETLLCIARSLKMNFVEIMEDPEQQRNVTARLVATKDGEAEVHETAHYRYKAHSAALARKVMAPLQITVRNRTPPPKPEWSTHDGEEFLFVIDGAVTVLTEQYAPLTLKKGESCYFDSRMRHAYMSAADGDSEVLSVCLSVHASGNGTAG